MVQHEKVWMLVTLEKKEGKVRGALGALGAVTTRVSASF